MRNHGGGILNATRTDIEDWLDSKGAIASKTRATIISCLAAFYDCMIREGILIEDPSAKVVRPKVRPGLPRPIADDDLRIALQLAKPRERCILALAAYAGLRCQEISKLKVADLLWAEGLIFVSEEGGKGGKERMVPMHPAIATALRSYGIPKNGYVLRARNGAPYSPQRISQKGNEFLDAIGLEETMHQLRHWFGTQVCRSGGVRTAQQLLGHANLATTAIYTQVTVDDTRSAVAALTSF
jgi:site-specific recombinase XerD